MNDYLTEDLAKLWAAEYNIEWGQEQVNFWAAIFTEICYTIYII